MSAAVENAELKAARERKDLLYSRRKEALAAEQAARDPEERRKQRDRARILWDMYQEACQEVRRLDPAVIKRKPADKKKNAGSGKALDVLMQSGAVWADLEGHTWSQLAGYTWGGDEPDGQERQRLRQSAVDSLRALSPRQREALTMYAAGLGVNQIARQLGVAPSTVSRTLAGARKKAERLILLRRQGQQTLAAQDTNLSDGKTPEARETADLRSKEALAGVVSSMTPKQLLYFCLYYAEGLTMREIKPLVGADFTAVSRTIHRAVLKLDRLFDGADVTVEHPEALDEAACLAWQELEAHPELVPERAREVLRKGQRPTAVRSRAWAPLAKPRTVVLRAEKAASGKLLELLRARVGMEKTGLLRWLEGVFLRLRQRLKPRQRL